MVLLATHKDMSIQVWYGAVVSLGEKKNKENCTTIKSLLFLFTSSNWPEGQYGCPSHDEVLKCYHMR